MPETTPTPGAALAQTSQVVGPLPERYSAIEQTDPLAARLPIVRTPETAGGPYGRVQCGKCGTEFLASRPNLRCPKCNGTPDAAGLERAFPTPAAATAKGEAK